MRNTTFCDTVTVTMTVQIDPTKKMQISEVLFDLT